MPTTIKILSRTLLFLHQLRNPKIIAIKIAVFTCFEATAAVWQCSVPTMLNSTFPGSAVSTNTDATLYATWGPEYGVTVLDPDGLPENVTTHIKNTFYNHLTVAVVVNIHQPGNGGGVYGVENDHGTYKPEFAMFDKAFTPYIDPAWPNHNGITNNATRNPNTTASGSVTGKVLPFTVTVNDTDTNDHYTAANRHIVLQTTAVVGNSGIPFGPFPNGDTTFTWFPATIPCTLQPLQLSLYVTPEINFGQTTTGTTTSKEMAITITSGTQVPSGTYTMTSQDAKANGRINLGGGEVTIRGSQNVEYQIGQAIPVTSRDTRLEAALDATGATPGPAESHLTVTMTVN